MLIKGSSLVDYPILSLHVGGAIARVSELIIDPNDLKVVALRLSGGQVLREHGDLLQTNKVREFSRIGMIIDSEDDFLQQDEAVQLDKIIKLNFNLIDLKVETKKGSKLGRVADFTLDTETFTILQLLVRRPIFKSLIDPELIVGRSQISEVTDYKIIVKNEEDKIRKDATTKDFVPNFVNPFREHGAYSMQDSHKMD